MKKIFNLATLIAVVSISLGSTAIVANANHSWGGYHWARTLNPFTLKLGNNLSSGWSSYLQTTSTDWSNSTVLDTLIVTGNGTRKCSATAGRVEVCNSNYGSNGWLGMASIWISGSHITQGTVKLNDAYFSLSRFSTPAWRNMVMCQEVGHTFGLDHQDENFYDTNLGTCMDYTNAPGNPPNNEHPNAHDFAQLVSIYAHSDITTTIAATTSTRANNEIENSDNPSEWGKEIRKDSRGRGSLFSKDLGNGEKLVTFVFWVE